MLTIVYYYGQLDLVQICLVVVMYETHQKWRYASCSLTKTCFFYVQHGR